jgi:hypothetical protein
MGWIYSEPFWFFCPDFADVFIWCQAFEGFELLGIIVTINKVAEALAEILE